MFQALENGDQRHCESRQKYVDRHISLGTLKRVFLTQDQPLYAQVYQVGKKSRGQRRCHPTHDDYSNLAPLHRIDADADCSESNDRADDGMRGGYGPAISRGDQQPGTGRQQRRQHAVNQQFG